MIEHPPVLVRQLLAMNIAEAVEASGWKDLNG